MPVEKMRDAQFETSEGYAYRTGCMPLGSSLARLSTSYCFAYGSRRVGLASRETVILSLDLDLGSSTFA